ncbi:hypothetical protein DPMN_165746 [Dreissena polymorpha]|uniref:Uncharacterized protein n=1 Tax=Dreissena polymorpha TaxID=45954 RepID=A0A9D4F0U7_DREPO|nr:hypothetical protein DPMN_165746 [Dreissena polymorpha]
MQLRFAIIVAIFATQCDGHPGGPPRQPPQVIRVQDTSNNADMLRRLSELDAGLATINAQLNDLKAAASNANQAQINDLLAQIRAQQISLASTDQQVANIQGQLKALDTNVNPDFLKNLLEKILRLEIAVQTLTLDLANLKAPVDPNASSNLPFPFPTAQRPLTIRELESGGWDLVFRGTSCNNQKIYPAYTAGTGTSNIKPTDMSRSYSSHYRRQNLESIWSSLTPRFVKFALYKDGLEVAHIIFKAEGSTFTNWFDKANVVASSWTDLTSTATYIFFSIDGFTENTFERRFYINRSHGGCPNDIGHFAAIDTTNADCPMDKHVCLPQFIYSETNFADLWGKERFGRADYMAVYISS